MLKLASHPESLIVLSPHLTELVFSAGAGELLIATVEYSEYPEAAMRIPRIGDAFRLDIERIVTLRPDLIIAWESGNPAAAVQQLTDLGLAVWLVEIREPSEIPDIIESIGVATGRTATAGAAATSFRRRLQALSAAYHDESAVDYFYQVDVKPLFTINGEHLISKSLLLCGGHNIFSDEGSLAFQVAHEAVIARNPRALIAPLSEGNSDPLAQWRTWPGMQAIQSDALFLLPADEISRASARLLDSLELACKLLHDLREKSEND